MSPLLQFANLFVTSASSLFKATSLWSAAFHNAGFLFLCARLQSLWAAAKSVANLLGKYLLCCLRLLLALCNIAAYTMACLTADFYCIRRKYIGQPRTRLLPERSRGAISCSRPPTQSSTRWRLAQNP